MFNNSCYLLVLLLFFFSQTTVMDQIMQFVEPGRQFVKDSIRLVKRCTKPDRKGTCSLITSDISFLIPLN